jgi:REP element-mobilizing transposase RayT
LASDAFYIYTKQLPHWRQVGRTYFVTWRVHKAQPEMIPEERDLVAQSLMHFHQQRYALWVYVVMNDHVHVLVQPTPPHELQSVVQGWKSFTAHAMKRQHGRLGTIWQDEYFDRIVRDETEYLEKMKYILGNPRKRWPEIESYRWVWMRED